MLSSPKDEPVRFFLSIFLTGIAAAACAPVVNTPKVDDALARMEADKQREIVFQQRYFDIRRLHKIAYPILRSNVELCENNTRNGSGIYVVNKYSFQKEYRKAALKIRNIDDPLIVMAVAKNSAADKAGFKESDVLISVNDWSIPLGKDGLTEIGDKFREIAKKTMPMAIKIIRDGKEKTLTLRPEKLCSYSYSIVQKPDVNAFADGKAISVYSGMMRFIESDEELAIVVGHEIAHNIMEHIGKQTGNYVIGTIFDILFTGIGIDTQGAFGRIGAKAFSQDFETEADYVGLYLMARAGYDITGAGYLWRRMGVMYPSTIKSSHTASHPSTPYRFVSLDKTVEEIEEKRKNGLPLMPNRQTEGKDAGRFDPPGDPFEGN